MTELFPGARTDGLKIISLQAENVKRLVAVRIDPRGNLVEITGKNSSGKTSILDSIWWAVGGLSNVQRSPIRKGQEKARIRLDLGEIIVTRTFTKAEGGEFTSTITVESADGARYPKAQTVLDSFIGALTLDPLEFQRMKPREQFDALKGMVAGVDFDKIDGLNRADHQRRTEVNRMAKSKATEAAAIAIPESVPAAKVDDSAITDELAEVGAFNAELERRAERREATAKQATDLEDGAVDTRRRAEELRIQAKAMDDAATTADAKAADLRTKLAGAEALPPPKDAAEVRARLEEAKRTNALVDQVSRRTALQAEASAYEAQAKQITDRMAAREEEKRQAIAAAKLPVEGIGFGEDHITLNGVPFDQASDAEQLRASIAIAISSNPRFRVIRVRDGSLLDEEALKLVEEMAGERDFQVWVERVETSGKVGFVIADGMVRGTPGAAEAQQAAE